MGKLLGIAFLVLATFFAGYSQELDEWPFTDARLTRPRTVASPGKSSEMRREVLSDSVYSKIYFSIIQDCSGKKIPEGISLSEKREKSAYAKNAAFVFWINADSQGVNLDFRDSSIKILNTFTADLPGLSAENPFAFLDYQWHSRILINYLTAYDLLLAAGVTPRILQKARKNLFSYIKELHFHSTKDFYGYSFLSNSRNNHGLMTAAAIGFGSLIIDSTSASSQEWLNSALVSIDKILWDEKKGLSGRNGMHGYSEGPYYFKYAFQNCLPFFKIMEKVLPDGEYSFKSGNKIIKIRHPYYDPAYDSLFKWSKEILLPDGSLPPIGDSYNNTFFPEIQLAGRNFLRLNAGELIDQLDGTNDLRVEFISSPRKNKETISQRDFISPASGNVILRNKGLYLHIITSNGKNFHNSGGHNQGDESSFMLYRDGHASAMDPGYVNYARRETVSRAENHNLILVDGKGPLSGNPGNSTEGETHLRNYFVTKDLRSVVIETAYQKANVKRRFLVLNDTFVVVADEAASQGAKTFEMLLHTPVPADSILSTPETHELEYGNERVYYQAVEGIDSVAFEPSPHEFTYDSVKYHHLLKTRKSGVKAGFLTLFAGNSTSPISSISDPVFSGYQIGRKTLLFKTDTLLQSISTDGKDFSTDARLMIAETEFTSWKTLYMEEGKTAMVNQQKIFESSGETTIFYEREKNGSFSGKVSGAGTVRFYTYREPAAVIGKSVGSWSYSQEDGAVEVTFTGKGQFYIERPLITANPINQEPELPFKISGNAKTNALNIVSTVDGEFEMMILDSKGAEIERREVRLARGMNTTTLPGSIPGGIYYFILNPKDGVGFFTLPLFL